MIQNKTLNSDVFWGLKENWWKQIYDGKYHEFGNEVFDKGLHGLDIEPGYFASIKKASEYAFKQIGVPLTIEHYKKIHHLACKHFAQVNQNAINVEKENIDKFRSTNCSCIRNLVKDSYEYEDSIQADKRRLSFVLLNSVRWNLLLRENISINAGCKKELSELSPEVKERVIKKFISNDFYARKKLDIEEFLNEGNPIYERAIESMEQIEKQWQATQKNLNLSEPFASLKIIDSAEEILVSVIYNYQDPVEIEQIVNKLIENYNKKMSKLPSNPCKRTLEENELALKNIAELFQNLEWLHPYFDGQGRTDLVLLAKLLTENGFNPSILYFPYFSTFEPLEKWISYLKDGMETWKKELEKEST